MTEINETQISYLYNTSKKTTVSKQDFFRNYLGVVWMAESDTENRETDFQLKQKKEKYTKFNAATLWLIALFLFSMLLLANTVPIINFIPILSIKILGLITTILLLSYELNRSNAFIKNICSSGIKSNCDAVLASKAARIGNMSWSEVGFFYFVATLTFLVAPNIGFNIKVLWLAIANAVVIPYVVFSLYYQWRILKNWCPLCLIVQGCVISELTWSIYNYWLAPYSDITVFNLSTIATILTCILFPPLIWYLLKPVLKKAQEASLYKNSYIRLHTNPVVLKSLLREQEKAPEGWQQLGITIGKMSATNHIIKVCNPYCGPCAKAHSNLEELIENNDTRVTILFSITNNENDITLLPAKHLLALSALHNQAKIKYILDDWYYSNSKNYQEFASRYPLNKELDEQQLQLNAMQIWCKKADITFTPTIFLNGYRLPENYTLEDLKHIL